MAIVELRALTGEDLTAALGLWQRCAGVGLGASDRPAELQRFLARNPGLSGGAFVSGQLVGAALCGHDGRRGYVHRLAVEPTQRRSGIGGRLVEWCLGRLAEAGITKCHIFVFSENREGLAFWRQLAWEQRRELQLFSQPIRPGGSPA